VCFACLEKSQQSLLASFRSVALFANFSVKTVLKEQVKRVKRSSSNLDDHGSSLPEKIIGAGEPRPSN
jgi:hypothetical protein